jgi:PleD family two-component response regulator
MDRYNFEPAIAEAFVPLSIGLAERLPNTPDFETLLRRADEALYRAKQAGRDCVMD